MLDKLRHIRYFIYGARKGAPYVDILLMPYEMRRANRAEYLIFAMFIVIGLACTAYLVSAGLVSDAAHPVVARIWDALGFPYPIQVWVSEAAIVEIPFITVGCIAGEYARKLVIWHYFMTVYRHHSFSLPVAPANFLTLFL